MTSFILCGSFCVVAGNEEVAAVLDKHLQKRVDYVPWFCKRRGVHICEKRHLHCNTWKFSLFTKMDAVFCQGVPVIRMNALFCIFLYFCDAGHFLYVWLKCTGRRLFFFVGFFFYFVKLKLKTGEIIRGIIEFLSFTFQCLFWNSSVSLCTSTTWTQQCETIGVEDYWWIMCPWQTSPNASRKHLHVFLLTLGAVVKGT